MSEQVVQDDRIEAERIREAAGYLKAMSDLHGDSMLQWSDETVRDAALKYAAFLDRRAREELR